jgi:hypothetical protein
LLEEKPLYIESEKGESAKSVKNVDISIVLEIFMCGIFATVLWRFCHTLKIRKPYQK